LTDELLFVPLGGAGEIGMNMSLYGCNGKWLMVDCGLTFADDTLPGIDLIFPDPSFIEERREDLVGLVLTHAHEDHLGAVAHLWPRLNCPVYATPFTMYLLQRKLSEAGLLDRVPLHEIAVGGSVDVGDFGVQYIQVTHSIPEAHSLAIETPHGTVVHSGDWKLDPDPLVGPTTDIAGLKAVGDKGVRALICDSTNALSPGRSRSESEVLASLTELFGEISGRIVVTTFASNIARIGSVARAAADNGRSLVVSGRSLHRNIEAAKACGYLLDMPKHLDEDEAGYLPGDNTVILCTGCQGEPRGAMARIAMHEHRHIHLEKGDTVIFSSKIIPGNEKTIGLVQNRLVYDGLKVITEKDRFVHVSGHPARDELKDYYGLVRPEVAVPVHGEARHLSRHSELATELGIKEAPVIENGDVLRLYPGPVKVIDHVATGRLALDGGQITASDSKTLQSRKRMMFNGIAFVVVVLDNKQKSVMTPRVTIRGVLDHADSLAEADLHDKSVEAAEQGLVSMKSDRRGDDSAIFDAVSVSVRRVLKQASKGRRPAVEVEVVRLN
jgi:ribonuclease J